MILAGSALSPINSFRNVIRLFGKDLATASRVWSRNPARLLGLTKGEIALGRDADLIVLDEALNLLATIAGGEIVCHAPQCPPAVVTGGTSSGRGPSDRNSRVGCCVSWGADMWRGLHRLEAIAMD